MPDGSMDMPVAFAPEPSNTRQLRDAFGRFATGVTVVTAASADGPVGIAANSFSSISLDPALVLWAPAKTSRRFPYFEAAEHYAIHVLSAEQAELCQGFAQNAHAFDSIPHTVNEHGVPLIDDCLARFECTKTASYDGGDHLIVVGEVDRAEMRDGDALTFYSGKYGLAAQP
ncbi:flavin reductase family protein [Candidatus Halocynthiibacter alkanivorans]|jgi:flavin reductase (DIM6/NTAB) family NADH-FMN oxidoreductase RutF|uniref:flavin reductase family protein n=1 Tax=Candidatus Halocynthiibacter alkanivorans TaxID=2267619 RepID=UPI000DF1A459|nr:flavin reductase family protein [Candidatus Halocynthiibacter alkanivorans]